MSTPVPALPPSLRAAIEALRAGRMVIMTDNEDRENEGDLVVAAEFATPAAINFMVTHARGLVCLCLDGARVDRLGLPPMVIDNTARHSTAFTVSIEARDGVTTGISASDRARTVQVAIAEDALPQDLVSPGHMFPLRAVDGGVLARAGHTEGSIDLLRLAGCKPAAVICEVMRKDGEMARLPELRMFGEQHGLPIVTIAELVAYRTAVDAANPDSDTALAQTVRHIATTRLPTSFSGDVAFVTHAFRDASGAEHLALVKGDLNAAGERDPVVVRLHSECVTGDVFGSLRCDCGSQLHAALAAIAQAEFGVLLYLRGHEGRGIGLANKIRAYALQDEGLDTVEANHRLGFAADARDWSVAAAILRHLNVRNLALLTNNPSKITAMQGRGFNVVERLPLEVPSNAHNQFYLRTKREKMGHVLDREDVGAVAGDGTRVAAVDSTRAAAE